MPATPTSEPRAQPWYRDGLCFACTGCGRCCTGHEGGVWIDEGEAAAMAAELGTVLPAFLTKYAHPAGKRYLLARRPRTGACVFLRGTRCGVYEARPGQCRGFPFWPENIASPAAWAAAARRCEGIGPVAPPVSVDEIERRAALV